MYSVYIVYRVLGCHKDYICISNGVCSWYVHRLYRVVESCTLCTWCTECWGVIRTTYVLRMEYVHGMYIGYIEL